MSSSNCCFLTCMQISQEAGQVVWYSHLFQNFPQFIVIHTVKGFSTVNKAEIDVFLELPCFLHDSINVDNLISSSSASLKPTLYIWKFSVCILLKPSLKVFEHNLAQESWMALHGMVHSFIYQVPFSTTRLWSMKGLLLLISIYFPFLCLGEAMAPHSSTLAWKIPWTEEPGRL